jgi:hypothetical protein
MSIYKRVAGNLVIQTVGATDTVTFEGSTANVANVVVDGTLTVNNSFQLPVFVDASARDAAISSPAPGMIVYVTGVGMQVRGATSWNTISGSGT